MALRISAEGYLNLLTTGVAIVSLLRRIGTWQIGSFVVPYWLAQDPRSLQTP